MKKILSALMVLLLSLGMMSLIGCGSKAKDSDSEEEVTLEEEVEVEDSSGSISSYESTDDYQDLEIVESGWTFIKNDYTAVVSAAIIVKNPNTADIWFPTVKATMKDADGKIIGSQDFYIMVLPGKDTVGLATTLRPSGDLEPATVDFTADLPNTNYPGSDEVIKSSEFEFSNVNYIDDEWSPSITGELTNKSDTNVDSPQLAVIYRDDAGKIVGGDATYCDDVKAGATIVFDASLYYIPETASKYDLYVIGW
jgi:hypothetical protein